MSDTQPALEPAPPGDATTSPAAEYLLAAPGLGARDCHAVTRTAAAQALSDRAIVPGRAAPPCGGPLARVLLQPVRFAHATAPAWARLCPTCTWHVATHSASRAAVPDRDLLEAELAAWGPPAATAAALRRELGVDADLPARICRAIITRSLTGYAEEITDPRIVALLGTVTAHRPELLVPEECGEDPSWCGHRPAELPDSADWTCEFPAAQAACGGCSVIAGPWAGEWEGDFDIAVGAPCGVLRAVADRYNVPRAQPATSGKEA